MLVINIFEIFQNILGICTLLNFIIMILLIYLNINKSSFRIISVQYGLPSVRLTAGRSIKWTKDHRSDESSFMKTTD